MVTSRLLEAFLACPVKRYLLSKGEIPPGTEYSALAAAREESYRRESLRKLPSQEMGPDIASALVTFAIGSAIAEPSGKDRGCGPESRSRWRSPRP